MIISIIGKQGSGKTLLLVLFGIHTDRKVKSNFEIDIDNYEKLELVDLLDLENDIDVFIDEGYTWLESRISSSHLNRYLSYIILQARKRTINVYITAQLFSSVDLRFRHQSDIIVKCKKLKEGFKYVFYNVSNHCIKSFILPIKKAEKYFDKYDTYEIINPNKKSALELSLLKDNPKKLMEHIRKISNKIFPELNKITHDSVSNALLKYGMELGFEKYVYIYLKNVENDSNNKDK